MARRTGLAKRSSRKSPSTSPLESTDATLNAVGRNVPRTEGIEKVTGRARYIDDISFPEMIYGGTFRSPIARGRIVSVAPDPAFDWSGFTIVDHRDIPVGGKNLVSLIVDDQPMLAEGRVMHREEPIVLLAHADRSRLEEGLRHILATFEEEPAILTLDEATEILKDITIDKGELGLGLRSADVIIEGTYRTGHQEQLYIETNGVIALPGVHGDPEGITVHGSLQCPFYVSRALEVLLGLPPEKVRVVQTTTGGGFGGKEEYPSLIAGHAALLAKKARRPVKMIYDRLEDLVATTKRHPSLVRHRTGLTRDGILTAMEIDFRLDGGAYTTLTPVVLSRGAIHAAGPYRVANVRIRARALRTNTPPNGAFRGFGAPQSLFAVECHMDRIAQELGMDPVLLRRKNLLRSGDRTATGQHLGGSVGALQVLERGLELHAVPARDEVAEIVHRSKRGRQRDAGNASATRKSGDPATHGDCNGNAGAPLRGTGIALFLHGSGFTGGGEIKLASRGAVELTRDGVRVLVGSTEIGQGTRTMLAQIVADTLAIPYDWVETSDPDTRAVPDSGPTVASRTCMIVGKILQSACAKLRAAVGPWQSPSEFRKRARRYLETVGRGHFEAQYERPGEMVWSDETYKGDAYGAYAWGCNIADVEIDPVTYQARCTRLIAVLDVGKAIHPLLVEGQIEGGSLQGVGFALYEEVVMRGGRMGNGQLTNYIIPTTLDTPEIVVGLVENAYEHGPFGAKGVGEAPIDGPAAAIINAIRAATGVRIDEVPATPEKIMQKLLAHAADASPAIAMASG